MLTNGSEQRRVIATKTSKGRGKGKDVEGEGTED